VVFGIYLWKSKWAVHDRRKVESLRLSYKVQGTHLWIEHDVDEDVATSQQVVLLLSDAEFRIRTIIMG